MPLLIIDVDGVMTDGTKLYDPLGQVIGKSFHDHDWTAIKKFQSRGWNVCFLSADQFNEKIAQDRKVDFFYSREPDGTIDKVKWLEKLLDHYKPGPVESVYYVGDDLFDLPIMIAVLGLPSGVGTALCPSNAVPQLRAYKGIRPIPEISGRGVIMRLYYMLFPTDTVAPCT